MFTSPEALAAGVAAAVARWLRHDGTDVGLAGGSTPRRAYERLRRARVPWAEVTAWVTDERHVPVDHPDSNAGMALRSLFDHVPATLHEVPWDPDPEVAASRYEQTLRTILPGDGGPRPGLVMLGIGDDGHTASLFPGSPVLAETTRHFAAVEVPGRGWRLTATPPLLAGARRIIFVASGSAKAESVAAAISGDRSLPAAVVAGLAEDVVWMLDREAAALL